MKNVLQYTKRKLSEIVQPSGANRDLALEFTTAGKRHWHGHLDGLLKSALRETTFAPLGKQER